MFSGMLIRYICSNRCTGLFVFLFAVSCIKLGAQTDHPAFRLNVTGVEKITLNTLVEENTILKPFMGAEPVSGLAISAGIRLNSDTSMVRVILVDADSREYLVFETYSLLAGEPYITISGFAEETVNLEGVVPRTLKFEVIDASVFVQEIVTGTDLRNARRRTRLQQQEQNTEKIRRINKILKEKGQKWVAGETNISRMSYEERKHFFGGKVPNLQGFEFYKAGIYTMPGIHDRPALQKSLTVPSKITLPYASEFSWRNRHGQDWMTPVRQQGSCGSCWAFGAVGATELLVNLYFNRQLNYDLSEQQLVSCSGAGDCSWGNLAQTLQYIQTYGVVDEACFPYVADDVSCSPCTYYDEKIYLGTVYYWTETFDCIKNMIINGPVAIEVLPWQHVVALAGYKTLEAGDSIFLRTDIEHHWTKITEGDPLIGQTAWLIKNSWGTSFGEDGYAWLVCDPTDLGWVYLLTLYASYALSDYDILCTDNDGDGYYTWGIGPKPDHCPPCPDLPDGDDSDPCVGPMDGYGRYTLLPLPPAVSDVTVNEGEPVPDLVAGGTDIRWYADAELAQMIHEGNTYSTGISGPGIYTFYVTQTSGGCESNPAELTLTIITEVAPPLVSDARGCVGCPVEVTAEGENLNWYLAPGNADVRDGQIYESVQIGDQIWMASNLNYYTPEGSVNIDDDSLGYAETYGRLYDWETAREVCPAGWKLPGDEDWKVLERAIGMSVTQSNMGGWRGTTEGAKLKESGTAHWLPGNTGTDDYGFTVRPAGFYSGSAFVFQHERAYFWTRSYTTTGVAVARSFSYNESRINRDFYIPGQYHSVRCIQTNPTLFASGDTLRNTFMAPGTYTLYVTQTLAGFESEPAEFSLTINPEPPLPPLVQDVEVFWGELIPPLIAEGENVRWYTDESLTECVFSGNTFETGKDQPGVYSYFVTQTDGCASEAVQVTLTILVRPPLAEDVFACFNDTIPDMIASGTNISWYADPELTQLLHTGNVYPTGQTSPGTYSFYITQTIMDFESEAIRVYLRIGQHPDLLSETDTSIYLRDTIIFAINDHYDDYEWFDGSSGSVLELTGEDLGLGMHAIWIRITDSLGCKVSDTLLLTVKNNTGTRDFNISDGIVIHPNPTSGPLNIQFPENPGKEADIAVLNQSGKILLHERIADPDIDKTVSLDLSPLPAGVYILRIIDKNIPAHALIVKTHP